MPKMLTTSGYNFIIIKNSTLTSLAKFSLSSGLPPRRVGYSQSKSKPSKSYFRRKSMAELTKSSRLSVEATIDENAPLPAFHPPTASRVFISRFLFLILLNLSYLLKTNYIYPKNWIQFCWSKTNFEWWIKNRKKEICSMLRMTIWKKKNTWK